MRNSAKTGRHLLVNSDCANMQEVSDDSADAIITSPPYADAKNYGDPDAEFDPADTSPWFAPKISEFLRVLKPGGVVVMVVGPRLNKGVYHPWRERLMLDMHDAGFTPWEVIAWHKKKFQPITNRMGQAVEWVQMYFKEGKGAWIDLDAFRQPYSARSIRNMEKDGLIKRFNRQKMEQSPEEYSNKTVKWTPHPKGAAARNHMEIISDGQKRARFKHYAAFPEELAEKFVAGCCPPDGTVVDPFSGTATTGVACERLGRRYVGYDLVAEWHEIGVSRMKEEVEADHGA